MAAPSSPSRTSSIRALFRSIESTAQRAEILSSTIHSPSNRSDMRTLSGETARDTLEPTSPSQQNSNDDGRGQKDLPVNQDARKQADHEKGFNEKASQPAQSQSTGGSPSVLKDKWMPWLQALASFFPYMNSWGILNSYGVFQTFYSEHLIPNEAASRIAWIGSMQAFLLLFVSVLTGPLIDAGYMTYILFFGTLTLFFGLMMTSLCTEYYQLMLAQGLVVGIGTGALFLPAITVPPQWFGPTQRTTVLGLVATGSSIGAIIYPVIFKSLQSEAGFGWATRTIAFITLPTNLFASLVLRTKTLPTQRRALINLSMFADPYYRLLCLSAFFVFIGLYIPIFFVQEYAVTHIPHISHNLAGYLVPILMAGSLPGRVLPNILAEKAKLGNLNVSIATTALCALLAFCWIAVRTSVGGLVVWTVFYGFASGAYVSLLPPLIVGLAEKKMQGLATRVGMVTTLGSFGVLLGAPVAGAILAGTKRYTGLQAWAGATLAMGFVLLLGVRWFKVGWKVRVKI